MKRYKSIFKETIKMGQRVKTKYGKGYVSEWNDKWAIIKLDKPIKITKSNQDKLNPYIDPHDPYYKDSIALIWLTAPQERIAIDVNDVERLRI